MVIPIISDTIAFFHHRTEKHVASRSIPKVKHLKDRARLATASSKGAAFDHSEWDGILKAHVTRGQTLPGGVVASTLNYDGVAADPRLPAYLAKLAAVDLDSLAPAEQLALLINAYNALTVSMIVEHEKASGAPLKSILKITRPGEPVWDQPAGTLGGKSVSLGEVEHAMLRAGWDEPAVHACIVCASGSCPDLRDEAFVGSRVREQMDEQVASFASNPTKGLAYDADSKTLTLSRIFLWFADDFGGFVSAANFAIDSLASAPAGHKVPSMSILRKAAHRRYHAYDWQMNRTQAEVIVER